MSCCTNTYFLGCFNHCGQITFGTASATETLTVIFSFAGIDSESSINTESGEPYVVNLSGLNENASYEMKLYNEEGEQQSIAIGEEEYDCVRFKTKVVYNSTAIAPVADVCCTPLTIEVDGLESYTLTLSQWSKFGAIPEIQVVIKIDGQYQNIAFEQIYDAMPNPTQITITLPGAPPDVWYIIVK